MLFSSVLAAPTWGDLVGVMEGVRGRGFHSLPCTWTGRLAIWRLGAGAESTAL